MARKIDEMHRLFGRYAGLEAKQCKDCSNFYRRRVGKLYRKCDIYGDSASESTDWNASFEACGMFNQEYSGTPIIDVLKSKKGKPDAPIKGQMSLSDLIGGD